ERLLTPYMEKIQHWSRKWRIKFSAPKSSLINFTRQRRQQVEPMIFLDGVRIPNTKEVKYLGVTFDQGLRWENQTEIAIKKALELKNLFKILTYSKHGPGIESLRTLYIALMRSKLEYGLIVYGASSKSRQQKLERIQNSILRTILGAPATTPIKDMQCELALESIETRRITLAGRYLIRIEQ
ncbi:Pol-like protein, partial [Daphnia magna]